MERRKNIQKKLRSNKQNYIFWKKELCDYSQVVKTSFWYANPGNLYTSLGIRCFRSLDLSQITKESKQSVTLFNVLFLYKGATLVNKKNDTNFVNESHLFTQGKTIVKTYTTTAREPSIYTYATKTS